MARLRAAVIAMLLAACSGSGDAAAPPTTTTIASTSTTTPAVATSTTTTIPPAGSPTVVPLRIESHVPDVATGELAAEVMGVLTDPRGWGRAGFEFTVDPASPFLVVLAEGDEVDRLCLPLKTGGFASCQNGAVVALNADRWRTATDTWDSDVTAYRQYLVNHEVGHLVGQRHPEPRCPNLGRAAAVMEQQTGGLRGCTGNGWPLAWEIEVAGRRPVTLAPLPDWAPGPPPVNPGA